MGLSETPAQLRERIRALQNRLDEAEETLRAFRCGEVDAIVAAGPDGDQVYTLVGADETYRLMVEGMAEGALTLAEDGLILFSNGQFADMLGLPLERVMGARIQEFVAVEDAGALAALLGGKAGGKAEVRLRVDASATHKPVYLSLQNLVLGGAPCYCLVVTDLSEQKRFEELEAIMESVPAAVFIARDPECRKIVGNRMAHQMLRTDAGTNVSKSARSIDEPRTWREFRDGREIPARDLPMQIAARTGQPVWDYEFEILFDSGVARCWLCNAVPLLDEVGQPRGAVGAFVDITNRKRASEALEATNAELRHFASALKHDLQEPLRKVVQSTQLLALESAGNRNENVDRYASSSVEGASKMEALLNGLFHYWEVTGRSGDSLAPVDCNTLLAQTLQTLQPAILKSGAVVTSDALPTVTGDELMLSQLLENLIGNAIQYQRDNAAPRVHVSAVRTGERWLFSVRDNGIGIARENAENVFGMFVRLHGNDIPGTGIGLALCRKVVERHGGRIWVESELGQGSSFRFTVPTFLESPLPGFSLPGLMPDLVPARGR